MLQISLRCGIPSPMISVVAVAVLFAFPSFLFIREAIWPPRSSLPLLHHASLAPSHHYRIRPTDRPADTNPVCRRRRGREIGTSLPSLPSFPSLAGCIVSLRQYPEGRGQCELTRGQRQVAFSTEGASQTSARILHVSIVEKLQLCA